jgi:glycosyltransferase involved in cell wall biosynthesis
LGVVAVIADIVLCFKAMFPQMQRWRIVVPVHNALPDVVLLLEHLESLNPELLAALILVDDGSTDGTTAFVAGKYPQVHLVHGDGNLWWGGGMKLGMENALDQGAELIFWLNHDCFPVRGAIEKLATILEDPSVGCVSGWCRIKGYPDYPVNPGFASFRSLTITGSSELVQADGVNGNFVGFRADAVRSVGLPDAERFPHYGDGVYTIRFSRSGYKVLVCTKARADLEFELERRLSPFWRVATSRGGLGEWLSYYYCSRRSLYNIANRYQQTRWLRGAWRARLYSSMMTVSVGLEVALGLISRYVIGVKTARTMCVEKHKKIWPEEKLRRELETAT